MSRLRVAGICVTILALGGIAFPVARWFVGGGEVHRVETTNLPRLDPVAIDSLRVMSFNIAHGRGLAFHQALLKREVIDRNLKGVADLITAVRPDVVGLQEADGVSDWSCQFDHVATLAGSVNMEHFRGNHGRGMGPVRLEFGTGLLCHDAMGNSLSRTFNTSFRDNKGFVMATIEPVAFAKMAIDVVSVHLDFASAGTRAEQLRVLEQNLALGERPTVVMGDFNCDWSADDCVREFAERTGLVTHRGTLNAPTFPADGPQHRLDWILVSPELEIRSLKVLDVQLSDHLPIIADIVLRAPY